MRSLLPYVVVFLVLGLVLVFLRAPVPPKVGFHVEPTLGKAAPDSMTVAWHTDTPLPGKVEYGVNEKLGYQAGHSEPLQDHAVTLEALEPDTQYFYRVVSGQLTSKIRTFQTPPAPLAFHVEPYLQLPAPDGMTIMWETTERLVGRVEYGPTPDNLNQSAGESRPAKLHQVRLSGLQPGTPYYYRVRSGSLQSNVNVFRTAPPPGTRKWRMALYGDSRSNPTVHRKVVEQIAKQNVDMILHTGDIVANGKDYKLWRREWFAPLAPIAGSVPFVSTIGNHEADADNYFSYVALPGNERHYGFDYANAHIVCLDSNTWLEKDGRDVKQRQWMEEHLKEPRDATWTFVAFHHPLFSAHKTRPINKLRWDWAPLFLDPACRIDAVLNGHDHFYARNYRMAKVTGEPTPGVYFTTSAGGAAPLYPVRQRDYIAFTRSIHHFTLFEFDGDQVKLSAIDTNGNVFDTYTLTKNPTPAEELAAYEVEELKEFLRKALSVMPAIEVGSARPLRVDTVLEVPTRFQVPVSGNLVWKPAPGWFFRSTAVPFTIQPGEPLKIPLQAMVETQGFGASPQLTLEFEPGKFRNRTIELYPFKLAGPLNVQVHRGTGTEANVNVDGKLDDPIWRSASPLHLLTTTVGGSPVVPGSVRVATDGLRLLIGASLADPEKKVKVQPPSASQEPSRLVLSSEHLRVEIHDGKETRVFALSAENIPYHSVDNLMTSHVWPAAAAQGDGTWTAEIAIPLDVFANPSQLRINVVHRSADRLQEYELRPTYGLGQNCDIIPDWKATTSPERFARLVWD